jgi:hypothetical protein
MMPSTTVQDHDPALIPEFGLSAEGFPVARLGDSAFAMLPGAGGGFSLASGWRRAKPIADWSRRDFCSHGGALADEAAFRALVLEQAEHQREKRALGRREVTSRASTPWGASQFATIYGDGVLFHSTASHGGFHLSPDRNAAVHPMLQSASGFYEEDCDWAAVAFAWPALFTALERRQAEESLRHNRPEAWEAIHGRALSPGESRERDRQCFERDHSKDWVVLSAIYSDKQRGFTEVLATRGGQRDPSAEEQRFLIPSAEYKADPFGFVVDETRHAAYDGPSSFIGWQDRRRR